MKERTGQQQGFDAFMPCGIVRRFGASEVGMERGE